MQLWRRRVGAPLKPLRDELLSIERLEERAKALAARLDRRSHPRPGRTRPVPRFDDNARVLRDAYVSLADDVHRGEFVTPAAEWLLDNFHLVASEIRDVRQNLPRGYYRELPKLATRQHAGDARVYAMAVELIRHSDSRLDRQQLLRFLNSYQTVAPLTIGELWAWPSMLKLGADREPAAAGRGGRRRARRAAGRRPLRRADRRRRPRPATAAAERDPPRVRRAAAAARARVRAAPVGGAGRRRRAPGRAADRRRGGDPRRAPATGGGAGLGGQRHHQPAPLRRRSTGASTSSPSAWWKACCSATRPAPTGGWTS